MNDIEMLQGDINAILKEGLSDSTRATRKQQVMAALMQAKATLILAQEMRRLANVAVENNGREGFLVTIKGK